jgi:hypothetical protein
MLDVEEVRSSIPAAEVASLAGSHPNACRKAPGHRIPRSAWDLRARRAVRGGSEPQPALGAVRAARYFLYLPSRDVAADLAYLTKTLSRQLAMPSVRWAPRVARSS